MIAQWNKDRIQQRRIDKVHKLGKKNVFEEDTSLRAGVSNIQPAEPYDPVCGVLGRVWM